MDRIGNSEVGFRDCAKMSTFCPCWGCYSLDKILGYDIFWDNYLVYSVIGAPFLKISRARCPTTGAYQLLGLKTEEAIRGREKRSLRDAQIFARQIVPYLEPEEDNVQDSQGSPGGFRVQNCGAVKWIRTWCGVSGHGGQEN